MNKTKIEWVKSPDGSQGYTWNPITGCLNQVGGMCKGGNFPCYAYGLANGRLNSRYLANDHITRTPYDKTRRFGRRYLEYEADPFYPRFWADRLEINHHFRFHRAVGRQRYRDRGIFVCDMSDLFGIGIPEEWTWEVFEEIKLCPNDRFYLLTKQPQNPIKFSPFPDNCWVGVTATSNGALSLALMGLRNMEAKVKFLSFEPLLGDVGMNDHMPIKGLIDWVIIGGQTKPTVYPKIEWVQEIVEACDKAGIPVFLKNNLKPLLADNWYEPYIHRLVDHPKLLKTALLQVRQELPSV